MELHFYAGENAGRLPGSPAPAIENGNALDVELIMAAFGGSDVKQSSKTAAMVH